MAAAALSSHERYDPDVPELRRNANRLRRRQSSASGPLERRLPQQQQQQQ